MRSRHTIPLILAAILLASALLLMHFGGYGLTLFVVIPTVVGALGAACTRATTPGKAALSGIGACVLSSLVFLVMGAEGFICILMALPLSGFFGALGGLLYLWIANPKRIQAAFMLLPIPLATSLGFDATAHSPVYEVTTSIEINAPPERVWPNIVSFPALAEPKEWYFKTGLAYPTRTRIVGGGLGATRYCDLSTGSAVETVTEWRPGQLLEFDVTETPPPMEEWSPYGHIDPTHLHGFMISKHGRFRLIPLAGGRTRVEGTSWYQHGGYPASYWRIWSDATIHRIHSRVLEHVRQLSEN
jgi:hypothetical protein